MALEQLVDCFNVKVGTTAIARGGSFDRGDAQADIVSQGDAVPGSEAIDDGPHDITAAIAAQDPLVVPVIAGLTFPLAIEAHGRLKAAATYRKLGVANGVLIGAGMELIDQQPGSCRLDLQNQAASQDLSIEAPTAAGNAPAVVTGRPTTIRILAANCTFTPIGAEAVTLLGLERVSWNARAIVQADAAPGSDFIGAVDVLGWNITGQISLLDTTITSSLAQCQHLTTLDRGALVTQCRIAGQADAALPPGDQNVTMSYVKFKNAREGLRTKANATGAVDFNAILFDGTNAKTLADMIAAAAA